MHKPYCANLKQCIGIFHIQEDIFGVFPKIMSYPHTLVRMDNLVLLLFW